MAKLEKIISGGQTGVDQAALRAATKCGFAIGGWCPPGRECESGVIPAHFPLQETPREHSPNAPKVPRSQRTEWNVRDSDATLIIQSKNRDTQDVGTDWTGRCAAHFARPLLVCNPANPEAKKEIQKWLTALQIRTLNVAGPSEGTVPGIGDQAYRLLCDALSSHVPPAKTVARNANRPDSASESISGDHLPWWLAYPVALFHRVLASRSFGLFKLSLCVALIVLLLTGLLYAGVRYFGLRVVAGQLYLGPAVPTLGAHATVDATAGFQNSGIMLKKGQKIVISPEGRIHIAMDHANNLTQAVKGVIVHKVEGKTFSDHMRQRYPLPALDESAVFYRDWCGPEGESAFSDLLEECKLRKELRWGALLAIVLPSPVSARGDPYEILRDNSLTSSDLVAIPAQSALLAERDGWLTFIINEAIISPHSPAQDSQLFYDALKRTAESLIGDPRHRIPLNSIPLMWFADNNGAFRITVSYQTEQ